MLTREENELLTRIGPGTPGGQLLRCYWQPAALSEELPPGGAPLPIRLLGEDLVLFRDDEDRLGLLGLHCSHRGADLSYGRIEDGGLRCIYHGWLYDAHGRCLEQPGEPAGSTFHEKIQHLAYACQEKGDIIFAYMGPGQPPLLPAYGVLTVPEEYRFNPTKQLIECNYLQASEGNFDPAHVPLLHRVQRTDPSSWTGYASALNGLTDVDPRVTIEAEETDFGVRVYALRHLGSGEVYFRVSNFVMPNLCAIGTRFGQDGYQVDWHVPIDDTRHWKYTAVFRRSAPLVDRDMKDVRSSLTTGYHRKRTAANRYLQDREEMKSRTFSGLGPVFQDHDAFAAEGQGSIHDRTVERLGYIDKAIVLGRQVMLRAIRDVQEGRDPIHVIREPSLNQLSHLVVRAETLPASTDWRTYQKELALEEHRARELSGT